MKVGDLVTFTGCPETKMVGIILYFDKKGDPVILSGKDEYTEYRNKVKVIVSESR